MLTEDERNRQVKKKTNELSALDINAVQSRMLTTGNWRNAMKQRLRKHDQSPRSFGSMKRIDDLPDDPVEREQMLRFWLEVLNARTINLEVQVDALWRMVSAKNRVVQPSLGNASHFCGKVRSGTKPVRKSLRDGDFD